MRILLDRRWLEKLQIIPGVRILEDYSSFLLVETETLPSSIPPGEIEILNATSINVHGQTFEIPEGVFRLQEEPHTLVRFIGPLSTAWRTRLDQQGVQVLFWAPRFGACLRLPPGMDETSLRTTFPFIAGAQPYRQAQAQRGLEDQTTDQRRQTGMPADLFDLVCFSRAERTPVEDELRRLGIEIVDRASSKLRVRYDGDPAVLREIVGVKLVDPARGPLLASNTPSSSPTGPPFAADTLLGTLGIPDNHLDGSGQIIAVSDTGLDTGLNDGKLHPDFRGRVAFLKSWPVNPSWQSYLNHPGTGDDAGDRNSGHGTHVAGLALGSGAASKLRLRGVAPGARLVFQAIEQYVETKPEVQAQLPSGYYLAGRPLNLRELFQESYEQGARIHINAWGDPARGQYTGDAYEADLFLSEHPDSVILFAAGNDGQDLNGDRVGDPQTLYSPASAKNVLTIGAAEGPRPNCGTPATWASLDPQRRRFLNFSDRAQDLSGHPQQMALLSSCGPTRDNRIKPDLAAPGTKLAAPRSTLLPLSKRGWGLANPLPFYLYNAGTSMAVGVAGGFMALLRQAWQHQLGKAPGGAALKALAVLSAQPLRQRGGSREEARCFGGFGRLSLAGGLPSSQVVLFENAPGLSTGQSNTYNLQVSQPGLLRAVLTWYDAPGEVLVNDLDLSLVDLVGSSYWGNHPANGSGAPDRANTVEVLNLRISLAGSYTLLVRGANVMSGAQPFALAVLLPPGAQLNALSVPIPPA